uniref:Uncharacterized protein n=1 Tax=Meloidogyne enterolobii TaxID=390850 RepID=A0A6V7WVE3_MELEN|nr:unnamed protein product [Meloidogyne enterolobii]
MKFDWNHLEWMEKTNNHMDHSSNLTTSNIHQSFHNITKNLLPTVLYIKSIILN